MFYEKCFHFQLRIKLVASEFAPASFFKVLPQKFKRFHRFRFHILAPYFIKNASASGSSKSQMLRSLLPLPAFFLQSASASTKN